MGFVVVLLAVGAAAAAYEWWMKPAVATPPVSPPPLTVASARAAAQARGAPLPPGIAGQDNAKMLNAPSANPDAYLAGDVIGARAWALSYFSAGVNLSAAGNSLVQAILLIAQKLGPNVVPANARLVVNRGQALNVDWPLFTNDASQRNPDGSLRRP